MRPKIGSCAEYSARCSIGLWNKQLDVVRQGKEVTNRPPNPSPAKPARDAPAQFENPMSGAFGPFSVTCANEQLDKAGSYATCAGLAIIADVQLGETENCWGLDSSHRGGHHRDIPCLVDASDVRTLDAMGIAKGPGKSGHPHPDPSPPPAPRGRRARPLSV